MLVLWALETAERCCGWMITTKLGFQVLKWTLCIASYVLLRLALSGVYHLAKFVSHT